MIRFWRSSRLLIAFDRICSCFLSLPPSPETRVFSSSAIEFASAIAIKFSFVCRSAQQQLLCPSIFVQYDFRVLARRYDYEHVSSKTGRRLDKVVKGLSRLKYFSAKEAGTRQAALQQLQLNKRMQVPLQENDFDCGVFLLYYIKQFIANANSWTSNELDLDLSDWFYPCEASRLRTIIQQDFQGLFDVKKQTQTDEQDFGTRISKQSDALESESTKLVLTPPQKATSSTQSLRLSNILDIPSYKLPRRKPNVARKIAERACITSVEFRANAEQKERDDAEKKRLKDVKKEERERKRAFATTKKARVEKKVRVLKKHDKALMTVPPQAMFLDLKKKRTFVSPLVDHVIRTH